MNSVQCGSGHGGGHRGGITRKNQFPVTLYHIYVMINYNIFGNFNDASLCCVQCSVCTTAVLECKADCVRVYKCISVYMYTTTTAGDIPAGPSLFVLFSKQV